MFASSGYIFHWLHFSVHFENEWKDCVRVLIVSVCSELYLLLMLSLANLKLDQFIFLATSVQRNTHDIHLPSTLLDTCAI